MEREREREKKKKKKRERNEDRGPDCALSTNTARPDRYSLLPGDNGRSFRYLFTKTQSS